MIELAHTTPAEWAERASAEPLALLSDHAHCELRAASSAQGLITHNPDRGDLVDRLVALSIEEMRHFRRVLDALRGMGGELRHAGASPYMEGLVTRALRTRGSVLLDRLLLSALIERRSQERFELLAEHARDPRLRELYRELLPSEAGHAELFRRLAETAFGSAATERLAELTALEGEVVAELPFAPRMHSGLAE